MYTLFGYLIISVYIPLADDLKIIFNTPENRGGSKLEGGIYLVQFYNQQKYNNHECTFKQLQGTYIKQKQPWLI